MTDIYVGKSKKSMKPVAIGILAAALCVGFAAAFFFRGDAEETETPYDEPIVKKEPARRVVDIAEPDSQSVVEHKPAPRSPGPTVDRSPELLAKARSAQTEGDLLTARSAYLEYLNYAGDESLRRSVESVLGDINIQLITTPRDMPEKIDYTVQSGDSLAKLAKRFDTTIELIQKANMLRGSTIRVGDRLRILKGEFQIEVDKSDNDLVLKLDKQFVKRYSVGTGKFNKTPVGDFKITDKIAQPTWWRPDGKAVPYGSTNNVLGTHWLSINVPGYGLHGTWEPETIGTQASAGCVRLLNEEIEELYTLVPTGTRVVITD